MRPVSGLRRYWDSCNFISMITEDEAERAEICQRILDDGEAGKLVIITSTLTIAEVIHMRGRPMLTDDEETTISNFFLHSYILLHDVTRIVAENARKLARQHGLRPNDSIHLSTALLSDADVFETWNTNDFSRIQGAPIEIRTPTWQGNLPLFS